MLPLYGMAVVAAHQGRAGAFGLCKRLTASAPDCKAWRCSPAMVASALQGTGRVNAGQGAVMTMQGIGAALSPLLGGAIADVFGFRAAFLLLGAIAMTALVLWCGCARMLRHERDAYSMS